MMAPLLLLLGVAVLLASRERASEPPPRAAAPRPKPSPLPAAARPWTPVRNPVTLQPGREYRAHVKLEGLEATFGGASDIAAALQEKAGPWADLRVRELGSDEYEATGVYAGKRRAASMPSQVTAVWYRL